MFYLFKLFFHSIRDFRIKLKLILFNCIIITIIVSFYLMNLLFAFSYKYKNKEKDWMQVAAKSQVDFV